MDNYTSPKEGRLSCRMPALLAAGEGTTDLAGDFVLPEYRPEIQRLLDARVTVSPADVYLSAAGCEVGGTVEYRILYCGGDGALYATSETAEYRLTLPLNLPSDARPEEGIACDVSVHAEAPLCRVTGPRKLSVRCRLHADVQILGTRTPEEMLEGDPQTRETLLGSAECMHAFVGRGELLTLADEITLEGTSADLRVIAAEGKVFVTDAEASSGSVLAMGEVALRLLYSNEGEPGSVSTIQRRIPFRASIPTEGVEVNCEATAFGVCRDCSITVEEQRILCEVGVLLSARAQRNETVPFVKDAYSTTAVCENQYRTIPFRRAEKCLNGNFTHGVNLPLSETGVRPSQNVVEVSADALIDRVENERGRCYLLGRCLCHLLLWEAGEWSTAELETPFRYETDAPRGKVDGWQAVAEVINARARSDGESISLDAEIALSASLWSEDSLTHLALSREGEAISAGQGDGWTVCYPAGEDTLWSVAARYHRPIGEILERNGIPGAPVADARESLEGISYLLI